VLRLPLSPLNLTLCCFPQVLLPALAVMVPVFIRGMKERQMLVKRKTVVVIHNVLRLVEDPSRAAPFLPQLIPWGGEGERWRWRTRVQGHSRALCYRRCRG